MLLSTGGGPTQIPAITLVNSDGSTFTQGGGNDTAANNDFLSWSCDPTHIPTSSSTADSTVAGGYVYLQRHILSTNGTIATIWCAVTGAGITLTAGQCLAGIYSATGVLLAQTANQATAWQSTGIKSMALTSPVAISGEFIWTALLANGSTLPAFARTVQSGSLGITNAGLSVARLRAANIAGGAATTLPASFVPASDLQAQVGVFWTGLKA